MATENPKQKLKPASLGVSDIVFFVVAAAAPLGATLGAGPIVFANDGAGAPGVYLLASLILLFFAIGFAAMSRHVSGAGGFAELVRRGVGESAGNAAAGVAILSYLTMLVGVYGQFSAFGANTINSFSGGTVPWQLIGLSGIAIVGVFGYRNVKLSAKVLGVLMILEVLILLIFDFAVLAQVPDKHITFDAFLPRKMLGPEFGIALIFAFCCFVGFESATIYGEEAVNPARTIPVATYLSICIIGVFYTLTAWCLGLAYSNQDVSAVADRNMLDFVFDANTKFVGNLSTQVMKILVVTSVFAVLLAFHNALCRYLYSLSRDGFLPAPLAKIHAKHSSPYIASLLLTICSLVIFLAFVFAHANPLKNIYMWMVGLGTLGVLIMQAMGAIAVIGFYFRTHKYNAWKGIAAPVIGGGGLLVAIYLAIVNFSQLSGVTEGIITQLPWLILAAAGLGLFNGWLRRRAQRQSRS